MWRGAMDYERTTDSVAGRFNIMWRLFTHVCLSPT